MPSKKKLPTASQEACTKLKKQVPYALITSLLLAAVAIIVACYLGSRMGEAIAEVGTPATELLAHLRRKGAFVAMAPVTFPGGLQGIAADRNLKANSKILELPLSELLFEETVSPDVRQACKALPCNASRTLLALGLAYERSVGELSLFSVFIKSLPEQVTNLVGWPSPMLQLMERAMPGTQSFLGREMRELTAANDLLANPTEINDLLWAIAMVQSRAFGAWDSMEVLIPGAGLLNHHWNPLETIPMPKCDTKARKCVVLTGERSISKGQQLFFHYRPWSNLQLLIRYGFAVPGNPWGPAITFAPLAKPPDWLLKAGCKPGPLQLRLGHNAEQAPLPPDIVRCARAAFFVADVSVGDAQGQAEQMWSAGAFNGSAAETSAPGSGALAEIAQACREMSKKWTAPEGLELLAEVAALTWFVAVDLVRGVQHELQLLKNCEQMVGEQ